MVKWRMSIMCLTFRTDSREVSDGVDTETWSTKESGNLIKSRSTQLKTSAWWISRRRQQRPNKTHSSFRQRKNSIDKIKRTTKWAQERASCAAEIWIKVYCKLPVSFDFDLNASSVRREITETLWCGCRRHCRCAHDSSEKPPGAVSNLLLVLSWFQLDHLIRVRLRKCFRPKSEHAARAARTNGKKELSSLVAHSYWSRDELKMKFYCNSFAASEAKAAEWSTIEKKY